MVSNPLKNTSQNGNLTQIEVKVKDIKRYLKPPPRKSVPNTDMSNQITKKPIYQLPNGAVVLPAIFATEKPGNEHTWTSQEVSKWLVNGL